jgi:plasmid stability protein
VRICDERLFRNLSCVFSRQQNCSTDIIEWFQAIFDDPVYGKPSQPVSRPALIAWLVFYIGFLGYAFSAHGGFLFIDTANLVIHEGGHNLFEWFGPTKDIGTLMLPVRIFIFLLLAVYACTAYNDCMQYTIRNVPDALDEALRRIARERGKSLNEAALEALTRGAGVTGERDRQRDLADIAGTWRKDPAFDSALAAQDTIDEEMWR